MVPCAPVRPLQPLSSKFTQSLLCEMDLGPLNIFPLHDLGFVSRGHRRKAFCFLILVICVSFSSTCSCVTCSFPSTWQLPAASSFPSHPPQKVLQQNASRDTPICKQLSLAPQRADFWQVSQHCTPVTSLPPRELAVPPPTRSRSQPGRGWGPFLVCSVSAPAVVAAPYICYSQIHFSSFASSQPISCYFYPLLYLIVFYIKLSHYCVVYVS